MSDRWHDFVICANSDPIQRKSIINVHRAFVFLQEKSMRSLILLSLFLNTLSISAQNLGNKSPKCDTVVFLDGSTKTVQVQEVKKSKIIYILCCNECAVPREFKLKEIDTIIYSNPPENKKIVSNTVTVEEEIKDSLKVDLNKNSLNISLGPGGILALFLPAHVSYERLYQGKVFGSKNSSILDFGIGGAAHWGGASPFLISRFGILTGSGHRHFEAKAGVCVFWDGDFEGVFPSAAIGYRKQKPDSRFIFRTGIGFPDALYISWGISF